MDYDQILNDHVGGFGIFQKILAVSHFLICIPGWAALIEVIFFGLRIKHRCISELNSLGSLNLTEDEIFRLSAPLEELESGKQCHLLSRDYTNFTREDVNILLGQNASSWQDLEVKKCDRWTYDLSEHGYTIAATFDLVCDDEWYLTQLQTYSLAGLMTGVLFSGWLADRYGRRPVIIGNQIVAVVSRTLTAVLTYNFTVFALVRTISIAACIGWYTTEFVLVMEIVGAKWRAKVANFGWFSFAILMCSTSSLSYWLKDYRWVVLIDTALFLPFFLFLCYLPESPKWLFMMKRNEEGMTILGTIAKANHRNIPEDADVHVPSLGKKFNPGILFCTPVMRKRTIVNCIIWFTISLLLYATLLNAVNLSGSIYLNMIYLGLTDLIACTYAFIFTDIKLLGRKINIFIGMIIGGSLLLLILVVPKGMPSVSLFLYFAGKLVISAVFNIVYVHTPETMPTVARSSGIAVASMSARLGSLLAPYLALWGQKDPMIISIVCGVLSIVVSFLVLLLPETLGTVLPDTVEEVEKEIQNFQFSKTQDVKLENGLLNKEDCSKQNCFSNTDQGIKDNTDL